jgi:hypothetical protein
VNSCTSCTYRSLVMAINTTMHVLTYFIINTAHVLPVLLGVLLLNYIYLVMDIQMTCVVFPTQYVL